MTWEPNKDQIVRAADHIGGPESINIWDEMARRFDRARAALLAGVGPDMDRMEEALRSYIEKHELALSHIERLEARVALLEASAEERVWWRAKRMPRFHDSGLAEELARLIDDVFGVQARAEHHRGTWGICMLLGPTLRPMLPLIQALAIGWGRGLESGIVAAIKSGLRAPAEWVDVESAEESPR